MPTKPPKKLDETTTTKTPCVHPNSPLGKGRPPGAKNKTTLFKAAMREGFENLLEKEGKKVFQACVEKALDGDTTAMKIIMDRIVPVVDIEKGQGKDKFNISINVQGMEAKITDMDSVDAEFVEVED